MHTQRKLLYKLPQTQRGVATIFAVLMMLSLLTFLAVVTDTGRLYLEKRSLQKNADLAALETALRYCRNQIDQVGIESLTLTSLQETGQVLSSERNNFNGSHTDSSLSASLNGNGVAVTLTHTVPASIFERLLPRNDNEVTLTASATAKACDSVAVFSVGTRLASLGASDSVVGNLLSGVGLDLGLNLIDYNGLAGVSVTPSGLLKALGIPVAADITIAEFNNLLAAREVSLGDILDATANLVGQSNLLNLNLDLISNLESELDANLPDIQLGSGGSDNGLFATITSPVDSALDVGIDALGLISTAIGIATSNRAVDVNLALLPGGLGGLLGADITVKAGIIEPPSIGIGGVGTKAYSAQTRIFAHIKFSSDDLLGGVTGGLLGNLLGTSVDIDIPLVIDLASASGEVMDLCTMPLKEKDVPPQCPAGEDCATMAVDAQIAKICVGDIDGDTAFSTSASCDIGLTSKQLLNVRLLGSSLIGLDTSLNIDPLEVQEEGDLAEAQMFTVDGNLNLGTTVNNLTDALLAALLGETLNSSPSLSYADRVDIAEEIWTEVNGNSCGSWNAGSICRADRLNQAQDRIDTTSNGLTSFVSDALLNPVLELLDSVLTLDLGGILGDVGSLVGGLLSGIGDLLGGILVGNPCTGGGLFGGYGTNSGCINELADALDTPSGQAQSNGLVFLTGLLLEVLKPILNSIGNDLLMPILQDLLGLQLGETEVNMLGLTCSDHSSLIK